MQKKGGVTFFSPQNAAGDSHEKSIAVISQTIEVNGEWDSNKKKKHNKTIKCLHTTGPK